DAAKSNFFANISHELRTPLTLILAPMESLLKRESGPLADVHRQHIEIMYQNALRLLKQINSLLDLAKLDAGRMKLLYRCGDLAAFFRGLVASVTPMAEKKHLTLIGYEDISLPSKVYFDHDQLEKVVLNLIFNALKFTPSGGRIDLRWGLSSEGEIQVQIIDTGIGITADDLPKLFKRFSQVDAATNRRYEGTGIGLALAKEIVELHGGRINVTSEVGRGTTMTVVIPLRIEPSEHDGDLDSTAHSLQPIDWTQELHAAAEHQQLTAGLSEPLVLSNEGLSPSNGVQVLVVEDNHDMREFIAFQLQGDYRVLKANNGVDGVRMAMEALPDLIVSDVMMPEKDGYQLCREIRGDAKTMHIPIILLTARADMAMKIEGLEHGADDYLTKPFNAQELRAKIKSLLALRQLEREIQQRNEALEAALAELKATQSQLVQSEKMAGLGLLVAGMAHEINNPINFAKNSLTILERAWAELKPLLADDAQRETIEDLDASVGIVRTGVQRTEQIVTQLKVFARKDQGMAVRCPVQEGLESTLRLIRPTVESGVIVRTDFQATGWISVIPGKLNQVWMNLLQNAIQAVGSSGEVWVTSRDHEHVVSVSVRDTGSGIKPEHVSKLFEPFFTTKPVGQGTGLGLSVSYQIIQDAGGRIEVKSEEGHGAEFTVFLPRVAALEQVA
ncbi:MAG: ATP-binding protein, partial [Nitrospiria bacterium]